MQNIPPVSMIALMEPPMIAAMEPFSNVQKAVFGPAPQLAIFTPFQSALLGV